MNRILEPSQHLSRFASRSPGALGDTVLTTTLMIIFVSLATLVLSLAAVRFPLDIPGGSLVGSDAYYWMVTFREMVEKGTWYIQAIDRSNTPFGESWFRPHPLQIVLFAVYWPLHLFFETGTAIYLSALIVPPVLGISLCLVAMWAAGPLLGRHRYWLMPMLFLQFPAFGQMLPGLVDHHVLMHLLFVTAIGLIVRTVTAEHKLRYAFSAGLIHGIGLWVSVEMFLLLLITSACGAVLWLLNPTPERGAAPVSRWHLAFSLGFLLTVFVGVVAEHPFDQWLNAEYDRISVVHVLVAVLVLGVWVAIDELHRRNWLPASVPGRLSTLTVAVGASLVIMYIVFPHFFLGPLADVDPDVRRLLHDVTGEMMPIQHHSTWIALGNLGLNPVALPLAIWLAVTGRNDYRWVACWTFIAAGLLMSMIMITIYVRFSAYLSCAAVFPFAWVLGKLIDYTRENLNPLSGIAVRAVAILTLLPGNGTLPISLTATAEHDTQFACQYKDIAPFLNTLDGTKTILAGIHYGPELLYFTRHRLVGTPNHRNIEAIRDTDRAMTDKSDQVAKSIIKNRGVDLVLLCAKKFPLPGSDPGTLYNRLLAMTPPNWLRMISLPDSISDTFSLYEVVR